MEIFDLSAEQASLGSMLLSQEAITVSIEMLTANDFYKPAHKIIFNCIKNMFRQNIAVDIVTLPVELKKQKQLEKIGGITYLLHLTHSVPTPANIEHYNNIIRKKTIQRKIYEIFQNIKKGKIKLEEGILQIESISQNDIQEETFSMILENTLQNSTKGTQYKFGIETFNQYLGGVDKGELITIGGYTSSGKSCLAIQLAIDFAQDGKKVLYLSTEMTPIEIGRRILSNLNRKNIMDFRRGKFEEGEREALQSIINIISKISDKWEMNIKKVNDINDIIKYVRKYKPEIVFIDYLQNMGGDSHLTDYQRVTRNIKDIQNLALQEEITVFVLSQLNRTKEIRRPKLADLRDSGRIEECSNIVIFLYWEDRMKERVGQRIGGEPPEALEIRISKNRDGTIGKCILNFYPEYCRIED